MHEAFRVLNTDLRYLLKLSCQRKRSSGGWVRQVKGLSKNKQTETPLCLIDTETQITLWEGVMGGRRE